MVHCEVQQPFQNSSCRFNRSDFAGAEDRRLCTGCLRSMVASLPAAIGAATAKVRASSESEPRPLASPITEAVEKTGQSLKLERAANLRLRTHHPNIPTIAMSQYYTPPLARQALRIASRRYPSSAFSRASPSGRRHPLIWTADLCLRDEVLPMRRSMSTRPSRPTRKPS